MTEVAVAVEELVVNEPPASVPEIFSPREQEPQVVAAVTETSQGVVQNRTES